MIYTINDLLIATKAEETTLENDSLNSIMKNSDKGATAFLVDIELTSDGLPVVCSNGKFDLLDGEKLIVSEYTYTEVRENFKKVVAIGQAIRLIKSYLSGLMLNIKSEKHLFAIKTLLVNDEHNDRTFIMGFTSDKIATLKSRFMALNFVADVSDFDIAWDNVKKSGAVGVRIDSKLLTEETVKLAHSYGFLVFSSVCNDEEKLKELMEMGVNFVETDDAELATPFLPKKDEEIN